MEKSDYICVCVCLLGRQVNVWHVCVCVRLSTELQSVSVWHHFIDTNPHSHKNTQGAALVVWSVVLSLWSSVCCCFSRWGWTWQLGLNHPGVGSRDTLWRGLERRFGCESSRPNIACKVSVTAGQAASTAAGKHVGQFQVTGRDEPSRFLKNSTVGKYSNPFSVFLFFFVFLFFWWLGETF